MAKSSTTFSKKEKEKKRLKKRQDKAEKMADRKASAVSGQSLEDMMVYVDENGNLTSTPPDPKKKKVISAHEISLDVRRSQTFEEEEEALNGTIQFYNDQKGYGFIRINGSGENVFFHLKSVNGTPVLGAKVTFETENSDKGPVAVKVKIN